MNEYQSKQRPRVVWKDGKCISHTAAKPGALTSSRARPKSRNTAEQSAKTPVTDTGPDNHNGSTYAAGSGRQKNGAGDISEFISVIVNKKHIVAAFLIILAVSIAIATVVTEMSDRGVAEQDDNKAVHYTEANDGEIAGGDEIVKSFHGRGHAVCIDPGHGFDDEGTSNPELGVYEKDVVLRVGLAVKEKLEAAGIKVYMTHDTNEPPEGSSEPYLFGMKKRNALANSLSDVSLFISIHCDAYYEDTTVNGARIYHMKDEAESESVANAIAEAIVSAGAEKEPIVNAMSGMNSYQVIRESEMPSVLIETGFISNPDEAKAMLTDEWVNTMAEAIAEAVMNSFESGIIGE